jgi:hypothetical protein
VRRDHARRHPCRGHRAVSRRDLNRSIGAELCLSTEQCQELGLRVGICRCLLLITEHAGSPDDLFAVFPLDVDMVNELGIHPVVSADSSGEIPSVNDMIQQELDGVFLSRVVPGRQMDGPLHGPVRHDGLERPLGSVSPCSFGIRSEDVTLEALADAFDRLAFQQRRNPQVLVHEVMHELAHIPLRAGGRIGPLIVTDLLDERSEMVARSVELLGKAGHAPNPTSLPANITQPSPLP